MRSFKAWPEHHKCCLVVVNLILVYEVKWLPWFMQCNNISDQNKWLHFLTEADWMLHLMLGTCCNMLPLVCPHSLLWAQGKHGVPVLPATLRFQRCSLSLGSVPGTHPMPSDFFLSCPDSQFTNQQSVEKVLMSCFIHDALLSMNYVALKLHRPRPIISWW